MGDYGLFDAFYKADSKVLRLDSAGADQVALPNYEILAPPKRSLS